MSKMLFAFHEKLTEEELLLLPESLNLEKTKNFEAVIFRLLAGSAKIEHTSSGNIIEPEIFYFDLSSEKNDNFYEKITENISPFSFTNLDEYFTTNLGRNYTFYSELFHEFSCYFYQTSEFRKNFTGGFLHLYRILESISYVFPMIWASKAKDGYYGTFETLKSFFNDPTRGEMKAFKMFLENFMSEEELDIPFTIVVHSSNSNWARLYYKTLKQNINEGDILDSQDPLDTDNSFPENIYIKVKAKALIDILINFRNKYFHFLSGRDNCFRINDIVDPDEFFCLINEQLVTWIAYIFRKILLWEVDQ